MQVSKATDADLEAMGKQSVSRGCLGSIPETTDFVYALKHRRELLAVGGIKLMNPTSAWAWLDLAPPALKHKTAVFRAIRDYLDGLMAKSGLTRLMAAVEPSFPEAIRTVLHLEFHEESRMPGFFGNEEGIMFVRLAES
jgi:hypothetical protein